MHGEVAERPQQMFMRVAVGIHKQDVDAAIETYDLMSQRYFTHATPTLFNSGTPRPQLSSCFLLTMKDVRARRSAGVGALSRSAACTAAAAAVVVAASGATSGCVRAATAQDSTAFVHAV